MMHFRGHIPALDGIRGLAILLVMIGHFLMPEFFQDNTHYQILHLGWLGVDLFFVLSGFLITGILSDAKDKSDSYWPYWTHFVRRRAFRIFPLYYFSVLLAWLIIIFVENAAGRLQGYDSFAWFWGFCPNIAMALKGDWHFHSHIVSMNHLWSVAIEEQFYLFWPFVVWLLPRRALFVLCALLVACSTPIREITDQYAGTKMSIAAYMLPWCRMDGLATGSFLALLLRLNWQKYIPYDRWLMRALVIGAAVLLIRQAMHGSQQTLATFSAIGFGALLYLSLNPNSNGLVRRVCETAFLKHLGQYSYGLYVFHEMFKYSWMEDMRHWLIHSGWSAWIAQPVYILIAGLFSYTLARISWALVERPFLKWK
jgi:peptidoglycan/LPS O-acetylase OafA/YrhL